MGLASAARPSAAMARFSPVSGTESAMVAMATSLRKDGMRTRSVRAAKAAGSAVSGRGGEQECVGELEGDGCAAEMLVGVGAVGLGGIDDGEAVGDLLVVG